LPLTWDSEVIGYARQIGMMQASQQDRLSLELALGVQIGYKVFFDRTSKVEVHIPGAVDYPKAALAKLACDAIAFV